MNRFKNPYGRCCCWVVSHGSTVSQAIPGTADTLRGSYMRGLKALLFTSALLAPLAFAPAGKTQVVVSVGQQPICSYGYYDYSPYACAPVGFYGPGYFYNGIFLGMGPWSGWGYSHGWGGHRFSNGGGGRYNGGGGAAANRGRAGSTTVVVHANNDGTVPVKNSLMYDEALAKFKVPAEMHIYQAGGHGFGLYNKTTTDDWFERLKSWMVANRWL